MLTRFCKFLMRTSLLQVTVVCLLFVGVGCNKNALRSAPTQLQTNSVSASAKPGADSPVVAAARAQIGVTTIYDPAYVGLAYPGGDVPEDRGVCMDVVIRAMRKGKAMNLQQLVHEDMRSAFDQYPKNWGLKKRTKTSTIGWCQTYAVILRGKVLRWKKLMADRISNRVTW